MAAFTSLVAQAEAAPAGGAALGEVVAVTTAVVLLTSALFVFGLRHRAGRTPRIDALLAFLTRGSGLPVWAAIPSALAAGSLLVAGLGLYWDVSLHLTAGRDEGPLANPSHYLILIGLLGIFAAGFLAVVLPEEKPGPSAIRIGPDWEAPVGGVMLAASASFALVGFPLDDVWHRLFGQDVTLWGPTHLMLIGGGVLTIPAILMLLAEGSASTREGRVQSAEGGVRPEPRLDFSWLVRWVIAVSAGGGLLAGLSAFQGEFDYGAPQYNLLFHPFLLALAAGFALVAARLLTGRGGALLAVGFFVFLRTALLVIVDPGLGQATAHFPLFVVEALCVEGVALLFGRSDGQTVGRSGGRGVVDRPYRFALVAGALIGTVGTVAEFGWSQVWMPVEWPAHILPLAFVVAVPVAMAAAVLGAFATTALKPRVAAALPARRAWAAPVVAVVVIACVGGALLPTTGAGDARATITLDDPDAARSHATVSFSPASAADDADWLYAFAWQGKEGEVVYGKLRELREGVWRTTEPLPIAGSWKSMIRLHRGRTMVSVPVYLPADPVIPVAGIPARAESTRAFVRDHDLLQRERKDDVPAYLWSLGFAVVGLLAAGILALWCWGTIRVARTSRTKPPQFRNSAIPQSPGMGDASREKAHA